MQRLLAVFPFNPDRTRPEELEFEIGLYASKAFCLRGNHVPLVLYPNDPPSAEVGRALAVAMRCPHDASTEVGLFVQARVSGWKLVDYLCSRTDWHQLMVIVGHGDMFARIDAAHFSASGVLLVDPRDRLVGQENILREQRFPFR